MTEELKVVEICAGAGGQSLGLEHAGFSHTLAVEIDHDACETLRANRSWAVAEGDVADPDVFNAADFPGVALLAGGVPCPPFSIAGKQLGPRDERDLFAYAVELVRTMHPKALLLENVRGLAAQRFAAYRARVIERLDQAGYAAQWQLLQASDYGVPQLRPRFVLVAFQKEYAPYFTWPDRADDPGTVGEAVGDLMAAREWPGAAAWQAKADRIAPTIVGGSKKHGGADLGPTRAKLAWERLAVDAHGVADEPPGPGAPVDLHPKLTIGMVARLQGWRNDSLHQWTFTGRKTSQYRQIGNAFPPPVAAALGRQIAAALRKESIALEIATAELAERHDVVYFVLAQHAAQYLTAPQIIAHAEGRGTRVRDIARRLRNLERDFDLDIVDQDGERAYRLTNFRGFLGEADHWRHEAFTQPHRVTRARPAPSSEDAAPARSG